MKDVLSIESLALSSLQGVLKTSWEIGRGLGWLCWSVKFFNRYNLEALLDLTGC